jgi:hypothetical protein
MLANLAWAVIGAVVVSTIALIFKKPRSYLRAWLNRRVHAIQLRLYLQYRLDTQAQIDGNRRAIERIAAELAQRRCDHEGNPDDEYYSDFYRWFTGDPDANVDYSRKQQRDRERLERGDFQKRWPSGT